MAHRRDEITMSEDELRDFLEEERVVTCATIGPSGRPHLMPLWYVPDGLELVGWTYARSQKAKNLERDARATLQVEAGVSGNEVRGAMMECDVEVERDPARVAEYGFALYKRYGGAEVSGDVREIVERQAPKRIGLRFRPTRIATWDHRKMDGAYP